MKRRPAQFEPDGCGAGAWSAIERVTDERMAERGQMNAYLVRAAAMGDGLHKRQAVMARKYLKLTMRGFAFSRGHAGKRLPSQAAAG